MRDLTFRIKSKDHSKWIYFTIGEKLPNGDVFTLGQFTGCHDKHGVAIYEGDIVRYRNKSRFEDALVVFEDGSFRCSYGWWGPKHITPFLITQKNIEVIGNMYDNRDIIGHNVSEEKNERSI